MLKFCFSLVFLGVVVANSINQWYRPTFRPIYNFPCIRTGGICVTAKDCPKGKLANETGLCPQQRSQGVECCYGIPNLEKRCRLQGGECMPHKSRCPEILTFKEATDCEAEEKCCILV